MSTPVLKRIVTASYETTDGRMFGTKSEAHAHQRDLTRIQELDALVKRGMSDGVTTVNDSMAAQIAAFILVYGDELREILPKRAVSAPVKLEPAVPVEALARADGDGTVTGTVATLSSATVLVTETPVEVAPVQNGELPVNPLAAPTDADAELAELMAGLDVATA